MAQFQLHERAKFVKSARAHPAPHLSGFIARMYGQLVHIIMVQPDGAKNFYGIQFDSGIRLVVPSHNLEKLPRTGPYEGQFDSVTIEFNGNWQEWARQLSGPYIEHGTPRARRRHK